MFLGTLYEKKTNRTKLKIVEGYRKDGKVKQRMIKDLGYLDDLEKQFDDPIAHFKAVAKQMTAEKNRIKETIQVMIPVNSALTRKDSLLPEQYTRKNIGYAALSILYHQLEIDYFLNNRRRYRKFEANLNSIFKMLIYNRALYPDSKKKAWEMRGIFFEDPRYSLEDVYRSLDYFLQWRSDLLKHLHAKMESQYSRDTMLLYYDVTNYYFEIDEPDELRKKGVSKEHRPKPIVQMGLFMDEQGLPVSYNLYQGNANDCTTLPSMLDDTVIGFGMHHLIVVADKGMMSGDNIARIRLLRNGYVISYSVRGSDQQFKDYVLDEQGYTEICDSEGHLVSKHKSRYSPREIWVTTADGKRKKSIVNERQIIIYSEAYARRAKKERQKAINKAGKQIWSLSKDAKPSNYGAAKYIKKVPYDRETGEWMDESEYMVFIDEERIAEEEQLDGYYVICTNVIGLAPQQKPFNKRYRYTSDGFFQLNKRVTDDDVIGMYKGLWRIEETFKVTKSDLKTRPVYVSKETHIRAHFLVCFVTLLLMRLLEFRMDWSHSSSAIQQALSSASGTIFEDNMYVFDYYDDVLEDVGKNLELDFSRKYMSAQQIRSFIGATKKT
jgi:transposase